MEQQTKIDKTSCKYDKRPMWRQHTRRQLKEELLLYRPPVPIVASYCWAEISTGDRIYETTITLKDTEGHILR